MKNFKKVMATILVFSMFIMLPCNISVRAATNTSGSFEQKITQLQSKFPHGKYWNHVGSSVNNPNGYTSTPCAKHGSCSYTGSCGCNSFNGQSIQCFGFAEKLAYDIFGTNPSRTWKKSGSISSVSKGDIIRYKNNSHSIFVTNVSGNTITYADCNSDGHCVIRWNQKINKSDVWGLNYVWHANNYDEIINTNADITKPTVSNWKIERTENNGYAVAANVSDNVGVTSVKCATWTETNGQDDLKWRDMTLSGDVARVYIPFSEHGNAVDNYINHIYVYDAAGNCVVAGVVFCRNQDIGTNQYVKIRNVYLNKVLANKDGKVVSVTSNSSINQIWKLERKNNRSYKVISCYDGMVMDVCGNGNSNGTEIIASASHDGNNQRWYFTADGGGYLMMPASALGMALDVYGKSSAENAQCVLYTWGSGDDAEIFKIEAVNNVEEYKAIALTPKLYNNENMEKTTTSFKEGETLYFQLEGKNASSLKLKLSRGNEVLREADVDAGYYMYRNLKAGNYVLECTPVNGIGMGQKVTVNFAVGDGTDNGKQVDVKFDANGGILTGSTSKTIIKGQNYGEMPTATRTGYIFEGWYTAKEGGTKVTSETKITASTNHTLYAHWSAKKYTLFVYNGDGAKSYTYTYKSKVTITADAPKSGMYFKKWLVKIGDGVEIADETKATTYFVMPAKTVVLQAIYEQIPTYTVTFDANGGTLSEKGSKIVTSGSRIGTLPTVTRTGYTFEGWYTEKTGGNKVTSETVVNDNYKLYAHWKQNKYFLTVYNGSGTSTLQYASGAQVTLKADIATEGMKFKNWSVDGGMEGNLKIADATSQIITFTMPSQDVTLRVIYEKISGKSDSKNKEIEVGTEFTSGNLKYEVIATNKVSVAGAKGVGTKQLAIPNSVSYKGTVYRVTEICDEAFKDEKITGVTIGDSVKKIGSCAFENCKKLTKVTIGKSTTKIGTKAFKGCGKLKDITVKSKKLKEVGKNALKGIKKDAKIKVPSAQYKQYKKLFSGKGQSKNTVIKKM